MAEVSFRFSKLGELGDGNNAKVVAEFHCGGIKVYESVVDLPKSKRSLKNISVQKLALKCIETCILSNATYTSGKGYTHVDNDSLVLDLEKLDGCRKLNVFLDNPSSENTQVPHSAFRKWGSRLKEVGGYKIPIIIPFILACIWIGKFSTNEVDEVCFKSIGCLALGYPWSERPVLFQFVPQSPSAIRSSFKLFSREYQSGLTLPRDSAEKDADSPLFDWGKGLHVIVHGYMDDGTTWVDTLKDALIHVGDTNVLLVDWRFGARVYYPQVAANTRVVGVEIATIIAAMQKKLGLSLAKVHLIGHSLGSHISGYVGKILPGIGKITALDPAFPLFDDYHELIGLHSSDAKLVEVFHSNVGPFGFGLQRPLGTVDVYLNDGRDQPGCVEMRKMLHRPLTVDRFSFSGIQDEIACSHRRAYEVYTELVKTNMMKVYPCSSLNSCNIDGNGKDGTDYSNCQILRQSLTSDSLKPGRYYLPTSSIAPFCATTIYFETYICDSQTTIRNIDLKIFIHATSFVIFEGSINPSLNIQNSVNIDCNLMNNHFKSLSFGYDTQFNSTSVCMSHVIFKIANGSSEDCNFKSIKLDQLKLKSAVVHSVHL